MIQLVANYSNLRQRLVAKEKLVAEFREIGGLQIIVDTAANVMLIDSPPCVDIRLIAEDRSELAKVAASPLMHKAQFASILLPTHSLGFMVVWIEVLHHAALCASYVL